MLIEDGTTLMSSFENVAFHAHSESSVRRKHEINVRLNLNDMGGFRRLGSSEVNVKHKLIARSVATQRSALACVGCEM